MKMIKEFLLFVMITTFIIPFLVKEPVTGNNKSYNDVATYCKEKDLPGIDSWTQVYEKDPDTGKRYEKYFIENPSGTISIVKKNNFGSYTILEKK